MAKGKNSLGTIMMLLLLIPISFGIYYAGQYLIDKPNDTSSDPTDAIKGVDVYIDGLKVEGKDYTYLLPNIGDSVLIDFKIEDSSNYYESNIVFTPNYEASEYLEIVDNFDTGQFVQTKITLLEKTKNAMVFFSDEKYSFNFSLKITAEYTNATTIEVPDISFYA